MISPWAVRNYHVVRQADSHDNARRLHSRLANNPEFYRHLTEEGWFAPWSEAADLASRPASYGPSEDEIVVTAIYAQACRPFAIEPRHVLVACVYRLSRLWGVCPLATDPDESDRASRAALCGGLFYFASSLWPAGGPGWSGRNWLKTPWLWGLLLVLVVYRGSRGLLDRHADAQHRWQSCIALAAGVGLRGKRLAASPAEGLTEHRRLQPLSALELALTPPAKPLL